MLDRKLGVDIRLANMKFVARAVMIFSVVLAVAALGMLAVSAFESLTWAHSRGTVTEIVSVKSKDGTTQTYPVVSFQTADGGQHSFQNQNYNFLDNYSVGQNVTVNYQPHDPSKASLDDLANNTIAVLFLLAIAGAFFVVGFFVNKRHYSELEKQQMDPLKRMNF
jgi:hypothetical protein